MKIITLYISIILLNLGCEKKNNQFEIIKGDWQITSFYYKNEDLSLINYYDLIGFEDKNRFWINVRENRESKFIDADYYIYKDSSINKLKIVNCKDFRFNHDFDVHIDTIDYSKESFLLKLTLDADNAYIEAVKMKLKYDFPPEIREYNEKNKR